MEPSNPTAARLRTITATASTPSPAPTPTRLRATVELATRPAVDVLEGDNRDDIVDEDIYRASDINANDGGGNDDGGRDTDGNEDNNVGGGEDNNNQSGVIFDSAKARAGRERRLFASSRNTVDTAARLLRLEPGDRLYDVWTERVVTFVTDIRSISTAEGLSAQRVERRVAYLTPMLE
ncbi:hypothetical protein SPI_03488 [Niveomyces insectorum RCEF 264]|uniref:Uncharacterized protein n=1 Tax=Niveomyces insectorum RCEF 264 TaxID=1081102 RepID=A0A167W4E0_9HYPO|nr:hypothetical protein SPI_03488 [Niveomyces insectorum RCEF 264]